MKHTKLEISEEKRNNLLTLAKYLMNLPEGYEEFDMGSYCKPDPSTAKYTPGSLEDPRFPTPHASVEALKVCGTVACALGHGPSAGIKPDPKLDVDWTVYSDRCFLESWSDVWEWCFGSTWAYTDNTPKGAAQRILYLLENGLPSNWYEQQNGHDYEGGPIDLCYTHITI